MGVHENEGVCVRSWLVGWLKTPSQEVWNKIMETIPRKLTRNEKREKKVKSDLFFLLI